jgi:hypothetical protein
MELEANDLARLWSQVSRGELILFTGAGFSIGAKDHSGRLIPSVSELKKGTLAVALSRRTLTTHTVQSAIFTALRCARRKRTSPTSCNRG